MVLGKLDIHMQKNETPREEASALAYMILGLKPSYNKAIPRPDWATSTYCHVPWIPQAPFFMLPYPWSLAFITVIIKYLYRAYFYYVPVTVLSALLKSSKQPMRQGLLL